MATQPLYRTAVLPEWIDYNGHLRDAYYIVVLSSAIDELMDRIGIDAAYRARTRGTLYSLEMHVHYLHEVLASDTIEVRQRILASDRKRIHLALEVHVARHPDPAATAEFMLLHVVQGDAPRSAPFPPEIAQAIEALKALSGEEPWAGPGSRALALPVR